MRKPGRSEAEGYFTRSQKKDDPLIKQKEKFERERDSRMGRLRDLRLAKEAAAAEPAAVQRPDAQEGPEAQSAPPPGARPPRS